MDALSTRSADEIAVARRLVLAGSGRPELNRMARLAARLLRSGSAQVSLLTEVQTVAGGAGLAAEMLGSQAPLADSLCMITAEGGEPLVVTDARRDDRVSDMSAVVSGIVGSYLGVPLRTDEGRAVGALCVFDPTPRDWSPADIGLLDQLAQSTAAELELAALADEVENSRVRWELAIEAAGVGSFDWDVVSGILDGDDRFRAVLGHPADASPPTIDVLLARVHPDDRRRVDVAFREAVAAGGAVEVEYRALSSSGDVRQVQARGRTIVDDSGKAVRLVGAITDTTQQRENEAGVVRVLETMSAAFIALDRAWQLTYVNAEAERVLGMSRDVLVGGNLWELFPALRGSEFEASYHAAMAGTTSSVEAYYPAPLDGWFDVRVSPAPDGVSVYFLDVTARRSAEDLTRLTAQLGEQLTAALDVGTAARDLARGVVPLLADRAIVSLVDRDGVLRDVAAWNDDSGPQEVAAAPVAARAGGPERDARVAEVLRSSEAVFISVPETVPAVPAPRAPDADGAPREAVPGRAALLPLVARDRVVGVLTLSHDAGRSPMSEQAVQAAVGIASRAGLALDNIALHAEQRATAHRLQEANHRLRAAAAHDRTVARDMQLLATTDALTGLPNRLLLMERLRHALALAHRNGWLVGVIFVDLDRFKQVNDSFGHEAGDELLQQTAQRLARHVRDSDTVSRLGGDEFVVVCEQVRSVDEVAAIAGKLRAALAPPFEIDGHELTVSAGIGATAGSSASAETLLREADRAMYGTKGEEQDADDRVSRVGVYDGSHDVLAHRRLALHAALRKGIPRDELVLHYQPIVDQTTGAAVAREALVRWQHPTLGLLHPVAFLDCTEGTALDALLGEWVLQRACDDAAAWDTALAVHVNVSARHVADPSLPDVVARCLARSGLTGDRLVLEITETQVLTASKAAVTLAAALAGMGVRLCLDDFGTGCSSIAALHRFPVDSVKIDRSFVADLPDGRRAAALVEGLIGLGAHLDLDVIAEGVETRAQADWLAARGCPRAQGFYLGRPAPLG